MTQNYSTWLQMKRVNCILGACERWNIPIFVFLQNLEHIFSVFHFLYFPYRVKIEYLNRNFTKLNFLGPKTSILRSKMYVLSPKTYVLKKTLWFLGQKQGSLNYPYIHNIQNTFYSVNTEYIPSKSNLYFCKKLVPT